MDTDNISDLCVVSFKNLQKVCKYVLNDKVECNHLLNTSKVCDINLCPYLECLCNFILDKNN